MAISWFGRIDGSRPCSSTTSKQQPAASFQNVLLKLVLVLRACVASSAATSARPAFSIHAPTVHSALYHSALSSTGLPWRGVTTQPLTLASIHEVPMPAALLDTSPAASTEIP